MPWSMPRGGPSPSSSRPARPMTAEARSICWTVWARETSCSLTAPTTPTLCVRRSRNAAPGRASNRCPDASTLRLSVPFFIATETSSSASSTNSSTSAPSPRDTKNTPTTTWHSSSSLPSDYGCDLMSLCLRAAKSLRDERVERPQGEACRSFRTPRLVALVPAVEVQVQPGHPGLHEALEEQRRRDRPGKAVAGNVVEVGNLGLEPAVIGLVQRQAPQGVALPFAVAQDGCRKLLVIGKEGGKIRSEGDTGGPGEGGHVDQQVRLLA